MTLDDLNNAVGENKIEFRKIGAPEISNIMEYVNVELEMDKKSLDYYYSINVDELLKSDMPLNDLDDLKEEGWAFDENRKNIVIYKSI